MNYTPTNWQTGELISAEKLNHLEQGVVQIDNRKSDKLPINFCGTFGDKSRAGHLPDPTYVPPNGQPGVQVGDMWVSGYTGLAYIWTGNGWQVREGVVTADNLDEGITVPMMVAACLDGPNEYIVHFEVTNSDNVTIDSAVITVTDPEKGWTEMWTDTVVGNTYSALVGFSQIYRVTAEGYQTAEGNIVEPEEGTHEVTISVMLQLAAESEPA